MAPKPRDNPADAEAVSAPPHGSCIGMGHGYTRVGVGLSNVPLWGDSSAPYCHPCSCLSLHANTLWPGIRSTKLQTVHFRHRSKPHVWYYHAAGWHVIWPCACMTGSARNTLTRQYRTVFSGQGDKGRLSVLIHRPGVHRSACQS